ncbi:unnamed protein product [Cercospora beticola]|nr:unnamed protein product [Cercospora beticola]
MCRAAVDSRVVCTTKLPSGMAERVVRIMLFCKFEARAPHLCGESSPWSPDCLTALGGKRVRRRCVDEQQSVQYGTSDAVDMSIAAPACAPRLAAAAAAASSSLITKIDAWSSSILSMSARSA